MVYTFNIWVGDASTHATVGESCVHESLGLTVCDAQPNGRS